LGPSEKHARTVHLVLSLKTGLVSPQYHVKFDDYFKTTRWKEYLPKSVWQIKARHLKLPPSSSPDLDPVTLTKTLSTTQEGKNMEQSSALQAEIHQREGTEGTNHDVPNNDYKQGIDTIVEDLPAITKMGQAELADSDQDTVTTSNHSKEIADDEAVTELRTRYGRKIVRPQKWIEGQEQRHSGNRLRWAINSMTESDELMYEEPNTFLHKLDNPMSLSAVIGDTMYLHQVLVKPDRQEFIKAMVKEIHTHQVRKHWAVTPIE